MQPIRTRLVLAALGLALAAPLAAQDAAAPAADQPAAAAPGTGGPGGGQAPRRRPRHLRPSARDRSRRRRRAAPAGRQPGQARGDGDRSSDTFGDWQVRCAPDGNECFMYQLALDEAKNPVAEVSLLKLPEGSEADAGVTVVTPLGTLLTTGVVLQIDAGEKRQYPFAWCSQVGCFARFGLAKPTIDAMKRGKAGKITLISVGKPERAGDAGPVALGLHRRLRLAGGPGHAGGAALPAPAAARGPLPVARAEAAQLTPAAPLGAASRKPRAPGPR